MAVKPTNLERPNPLAQFGARRTQEEAAEHEQRAEATPRDAPSQPNSQQPAVAQGANTAAATTAASKDIHGKTRVINVPLPFELWQRGKIALALEDTDWRSLFLRLLEDYLDSRNYRLPEASQSTREN